MPRASPEFSTKCPPLFSVQEDEFHAKPPPTTDFYTSSRMSFMDPEALYVDEGGKMGDDGAASRPEIKNRATHHNAGGRSA